MCIVCVFFFFFKQKTAYEMRISDWSSDVCSSDLAMIVRKVMYWNKCSAVKCRAIQSASSSSIGCTPLVLVRMARMAAERRHHLLHAGRARRSDERRVGKACVGPCSSRGSPYHSKKKKPSTNLPHTDTIKQQ